MATSKVKLLGAPPSPFVNRVQISLNLKSVDYEFIPENPYCKSELLLKYNPVNKKIPVLVHDDKPICESLVIVQYIDDTWISSPSILPSDPYDRAIARFWASYVDDKWFPLVKQLQSAEGEEAKAATLEKIAEGTVMLEEAFEKCSKGKAFFGGDSIGYVDITLGSYMGWAKAIEKMANFKILDETKTSALCKWADTFLADKAVKDVILAPEKLVEIFKMMMQAQQKPTSN